MTMAFVMMPFGSRYDRIYEAVRRALQNAGLRCLRGDESVKVGEIPAQIRADIRRASICIADLSGHNPNVMFEVGQALSNKKPVLFIARGDLKRLPFDINHHRVLRYDPRDLDTLEARLAAWVRATLKLPPSENEMLRCMLAPPSAESESPFVVAASPLSYRAAKKRTSKLDVLRRTFSDHAGIRGLIQGFGIMFGMRRLPELVDPGDFSDSFLFGDATDGTGKKTRKMHLFAIGSPKSNRWTGQVLQRFCNTHTPRFRFSADPESEDLANAHIEVRVQRGRKWEPYRPPQAPLVRDTAAYGLIIRGPFPGAENHMLMIVAGGSALGTHAASLAATTPKHIEEIRTRLSNEHKIELLDHRQSFWAVAHIRERRRARFYHDPDLETLSIAHVGRFRRQ